MVSPNNRLTLRPSTIVVFASTLLLFIGLVPSAHAHGFDEALLDDAAVARLEQQAAGAQLKEQAFLYTEILHSLTEVAGKQLADGQDDQARFTFQHIDVVSGKLQAALAKDAKRLQKAEMLMDHITKRLADMVHITSGDQRTTLQATLSHVNAVQTLLLTQVFAK